MKVQDVMTRDVQTCRPETNLAPVAMTMYHFDCGTIPVVDDEGRVVGMITDRDICIALATKHQNAWDVQVRDVISWKVYACSPDDDITTALRVMRQERVRRLPVIDSGGRLQGLLSINDVVLHVKEAMRHRPPDFTYEAVMETFEAFCGHRPLVGI